MDYITVIDDLGNIDQIAPFDGHCLLARSWEEKATK